MAAKIPKKKVDAAIAELKKVRKSWLARPGVTGVDVGFKVNGTVMTDELAVRVHVARKIPVESLASPAEAFGESGKVTRLGDFEVDVIEASYGLTGGPTDGATAGPASADEPIDRADRSEPLVGGISVSNARGGAGTLGAVVWDEVDGQACLLSNWHVLGRRKTCRVGEKIYQPGPQDGGRSADTVATLKRWKIDRHGDAALAVLTGARQHTRDILGLDPVRGMVEPALGMLLVKSGRSTRVTRARVDGLAFSFVMTYPNGEQQAFDDQIHIVPRPPWPDPAGEDQTDYEISEGGDSGSLWIEEASGKAVGLHFAGEDSRSVTAEFAVATPIARLAEALRFSFAPLIRAAAPDEDRRFEALRRVLARNLERKLPDLGRQEIADLIDGMMPELREELRRTTP